MKFHLLTIFPDIFDSYFNESLFKRARAKRIITIKTYDLRAYTKDKHKKVDDRPFGGGPGMVMNVQPIYDAIKTIIKRSSKRNARIILFSTRGKKLNAAAAKRLSKYKELILICGRYEGVDERVAQNIADEEISIGDYILSGGELPAMVFAEAVSRHIPGFLGKEESLEEKNGSFPTYTRPEVFFPQKGKGWPVPEVLLSGNHKKIAEWREGR